MEECLRNPLSVVLLTAISDYRSGRKSPLYRLGRLLCDLSSRVKIRLDPDRFLVNPDVFER